jgi:hypothetical protein
VLPEHTEEFTMPTKKRLWLNKEECLFPGPHHPGQQHQKKPVSLAVDRAFDLSPKNAQLVSQQRVFRKEFGFPTHHFGKCATHKGSRRWFEPTRKRGLERATARTHSLLDQSEYTTHEIEPFLRENRNLAREYE